jgi:hypothetical protein
MEVMWNIAALKESFEGVIFGCMCVLGIVICW